MSQDFKEVFEIQRKFTEKLFIEKHGVTLDELTNEQRLSFSKEYILCCSKEIYEMLDELNWKTHRYLKQNENMDNFIEEGIDAFKFLLNLMIVNGFNAEDFYTKFLEKSIVVDIRYEQEKQLLNINKEDKFVVFDIDGVLNDYPNNFVRYFQSKGYEYKTIKQFKVADLNTYNKLKHEFRVTGEERNCVVSKEGVESINYFKQKGFKIILLTARPYNKITRLFFDTIHWLNENEIHYDFIFFNKKKEEYLINTLGDLNIEFVVDDEIDNVNKLCEYFKTYLLTSKKLEYINKKVCIIDSLTKIEI